MPSNITDADTFDTTVTYPNDGESANVASLRDTFVQKLSNRTKYLLNRIAGVASGAGTWIDVPLTPFSVSASAAAAASAGQCFVSQTSITGAALGTVQWAVPQFFGAKIIAARIRLQGASGHSALPDTTMPQFVLFTVDTTVSSPSSTNVASANDTSVNVAAYEAAHYITLSGLNIPYVVGKNVFLVAQGEDGTGTTEILGLKFWGVQVQISPL